MNLIFMLQVSGLKFPDHIPQKEEHVAFKWVSMDALNTVDLRPLPLRSALTQWLQNLDHAALWSTMT
jgi:hypothetical protein